MAAQTYHLTISRRLVNRAITALLRLGLLPKPNYLLTVRGRKSGQPHTTPVSLVEHDDQRWIVAPYGAVNWVRNARAAGRVQLSRGRHREEVRVTELGPEESAPILKEYLTAVRVTRPFFDVTPDSPLEAFAAEAPRHPVFRVDGVAMRPT